MPISLVQEMLSEGRLRSLGIHPVHTVSRGPRTSFGDGEQHAFDGVNDEMRPCGTSRQTLGGKMGLRRSPLADKPTPSEGCWECWVNVVFPGKVGRIKTKLRVIGSTIASERSHCCWFPVRRDCPVLTCVSFSEIWKNPVAAVLISIRQLNGLSRRRRRGTD